MPIHRIVVSSLFLATLAGGSARAEDTHTVKTAPAKATVGVPAIVSVTIEGRNGWHINGEAPISLKLAPQTGVTVAKPKQNRTDLAESTETKARFDVSATMAEAGAKTIGAEASFVVCQESACKPVKETLTLTLATETAAAPVTKTKAKSKRKV
jgi:hypothetical protein